MFFHESERIASSVPEARETIEEIDRVLADVEGTIPYDIDPSFIAAHLGVAAAKIDWALDLMVAEGLLSVTHLTICPDTDVVVGEIPDNPNVPFPCDICGKQHQLAECRFEARYALLRLAPPTVPDVVPPHPEQDPSEVPSTASHGRQFWVGVTAAGAAVVVAAVAVVTLVLELNGSGGAVVVNVTPTPPL